jgi:S1-C subfamily serine protease
VLNCVVVDMSRQTQGVLSHASPAGSIGSGLLKRFNVTFDYPRQRIYFAPTPHTGTPDAFDRSGLWINRTAGGFRVVAVAPRSPAEVAGVRDNDVIVAVGGKSAASILLADLRDRLRDAPPGTAVQLTLRAGQGTRVVTLQLRDLI